MSLASRQIGRFDDLPKYRAPASDGDALVAPNLRNLLDGYQSVSNHSGHAYERLNFAGMGWRRLRASSRHAAYNAAIAYTSQYRPTASWNAQRIDGPWIVAGHQPEIFHPGVWFKNFLLSEATAYSGGVGLNLVIDNDLCRAPGIRVLTRDKNNSHLLRTEAVLFDAPASAVAWECRPIADRQMFATFPKRVRETLLSDVAQPLVDQLWHYAMQASQRTGRLGLVLAQARHAYEAELGLNTLELPLSQLCNQAGFARFSLEVLSRLPAFQSIYNQQREAYRSANSIRSEAHPVPALDARNGWLEAPWWVYRDSAPTRKRLYVKRDDSGNDLLLSDLAGWQGIIEGPVESDDAVEQWQEFAVDGILLRPRALVTTMFARLILSDLFMHGIGGGKYDQLTDAIISEFFHVPPPAMCVATATVHLPLDESRLQGSTAEIEHAIEQEQKRVRNLRYHPEEHLTGPDDEAQALLIRKQEMLRAIPPRGEKWAWHKELTRINQRLAELNQNAMQQGELKIQELQGIGRQLKLARSREFSFCLFEQSHIVPKLSALAASQFADHAAK